MKFRYFGGSALLAEVASSAAAQQLRHALLQADIVGVRELVPGYNTLLIEFDPLILDMAKLERRLPKLSEQPPPAWEQREHEISVRYDGEDLQEVARLAGIGIAEVIQRHCAPLYTVAFLGFAPGFPYLSGLDPKLQVPRLKSPRTRVAAGSVAIAGEFAGIYPQATPGGWRVLGHTDSVLFDAGRAQPALLTPGDKLRFRPLP
ncbi:MAG: 5-oxoprolinase subunit PxpB [Gammaproteobacteria bacterium]|nr:5-oxoprolinase subunit PxpB [Gammaproteobacteria bacterium]MBU6509850.1 5-oxoprolinase subunit PxpB [Gammaproteobacteria bacterium]MDE1984003.1 5-oxoprolinase subunit PxpB [Gammaproteobacteria bacterium]MDE2108074.1 5-oxoprolinase subunit PxpB [Gammaproteobacteria bacterium]MDE2461385.1 5-oxoprolinase subunit PxpB [Gammaproteobacteria bacterium]